VSTAGEDEPDIIEYLSAGRLLRLVKTLEAKRPEPDPEFKAMLDDVRTRDRVRRAGRDPGGKDAA
jgi:hypothetical protein